MPKASWPPSSRSYNTPRTPSLPQTFAQIRKSSSMNSIKFVHLRSNASDVFFMNFIWTLQYGLIMEEMSCARRSGEMVVVWRAAPIIQVNVSSLTKFRQTKQKLTPAASGTRTTLTAAGVCFRLCYKTMTAQSMASKSCVGVTKRLMATGEWKHWTLKAMVTCQRRPIIPISFCTDNKIIMPQLDHFHAPTNQNCTSNQKHSNGP